MKKTILLLCIAFLIIFSGCSNTSVGNSETLSKNTDNSEKNSEQTIDTSAAIANERISIYDINNVKIGEIERYGILVQTDDSIIYTKIPTGSVDSITEMDYYRYIFAKNESIKLGTIKNWSYEAKYDTSIIGNSLYMFITTGDIYDINNRTLELYKVDLTNNTMSSVFSEKGGFPYNTMTVVGNKLLMSRVLAAGGCELEEYDTITEKRKLLKKFDFNDQTNMGETIRQISSDENTVSLLRLKMESENKINMYLDVYDHDMNFIRSANVSTIPSNISDSPGNELQQGVSNFIFTNNYIYYANFSITRFLGKIENNSLRSILEVNPEFEISAEVVKNKSTSLFFQSFNQSNDLYLLNCSDGTIKKSSFKADDERYYIIYISRDTNNNLLITMNYKDPDTGEKLPSKLYYINSSDIEFK